MDTVFITKIIHDTIQTIKPLQLSNWTEIVSFSKEIIILLSTLTAALLGIKAWDKQLREKTKFEFNMKILEEKNHC